MNGWLRSLVTASALTLLTAHAAAWSLPPADRIAFAPRNDARLPEAVQVADETAWVSPLGHYFRARPVLFVPAYYGCSNLCTTVLSALATSLSRGNVVAGRDVDVVVLSIDPLDSPASARAKKHALLDDGKATGWHFLTAQSGAIEAIVQSLGYRYAYDDGERQFAHAVGAAVVDRNGRIVRVVSPFEPKDLRAAINVAERNEGDVQRARAVDEPTASASPDLTSRDIAAAPFSPWLLCFHFDPITGRYTFAAWNAVRIVAGASFAVLGLFIIRTRLRERRTLPNS